MPAPYRLRKAPGRPLYWVVSADGKKHSKEPIPKARAEAQRRALYASESGYTMRGGMDKPALASCEGTTHIGETTLTREELDGLKDILESDDVTADDVKRVIKTLRVTLSDPIDQSLVQEAANSLSSRGTRSQTVNKAINYLSVVIDRVFPKQMRGGAEEDIEDEELAALMGDLSFKPIGEEKEMERPSAPAPVRPKPAPRKVKPHEKPPKKEPKKDKKRKADRDLETVMEEDEKDGEGYFGGVDPNTKIEGYNTLRNGISMAVSKVPGFGSIAGPLVNAALPRIKMPSQQDWKRSASLKMAAGLQELNKLVDNVRNFFQGFDKIALDPGTPQRLANYMRSINHYYLGLKRDPFTQRLRDRINQFWKDMIYKLGRTPSMPEEDLKALGKFIYILSMMAKNEPDFRPLVEQANEVAESGESEIDPIDIITQGAEQTEVEVPERKERTAAYSESDQQFEQRLKDEANRRGYLTIDTAIEGPRNIGEMASAVAEQGLEMAKEKAKQMAKDRAKKVVSDLLSGSGKMRGRKSKRGGQCRSMSPECYCGGEDTVDPSLEVPNPPMIPTGSFEAMVPRPIPYLAGEYVQPYSPARGFQGAASGGSLPSKPPTGYKVPAVRLLAEKRAIDLARDYAWFRRQTGLPQRVRGVF